MIILGDYSDEVTGLGLAGSIFLSVLGVDLPADIRDLTACFTVNFDPSDPMWWMNLGSCAVSFLPLVGGLKYVDEGAELLKYSDEAAEAAGDVGKHLDEAVESGSKTEVIMPSKPHTNGTIGHWETILDEVDVMKNSGDYSKIYVNKGLSNEIPGAKPNRRPDIMGVRNDGLIDQVEVPSKTDIPDLLIDRMIDNQRIIGDRAGNIKIRDIGGN